MSGERRAEPAPSAADLGGSVDETPVVEAETGPAGAVRRDSSPAARRRGRMTLRIPDDEIARPQLDGADAARALSRPPPAPPEVARPDNDGAGVVLTPMRIISIGSDAPPPVLRVEAPVSEPALSHLEEGWTPIASAVSMDESISIDAMDDGEVVSIQVDGPTSDSAIYAGDSSGELPTSPVLPAAPSTPRAVSSDVLASGRDDAEDEDEEVRFDDDSQTPSIPRVEVAPTSDNERRSDPGDAPEISVEDMVAVEAVPAPAPRPVLDLPPMRPRAQSQPMVPPPASRAPAPVAAPIKPPLLIVPPHVGNLSPPSADATGVRRKGRLWWEELFNDDYVRTMEKVSDAQVKSEADFIETSLGIERGGAMLDLACGTGRQAIDLAARGYEVVAFDLSLSMLARAGDDAQEHDVKLNFVQGDMREMNFDAQFDGVYCWNTSFGFFDEEKNAQVIDRVHRALKPGGLFLLDVANRDFIVRQSPSLAWFEGDGCICMDEMTVDFITSRMKVKRTLMLDDGRSRETEYSMRIYSLHELGKLLHEHGFKVCEVSGRLATPGVFFGNESPRTIILAEKR